MNSFNPDSNLNRWKEVLNNLNEDSSFIEDNRFDFFQKCAMYRSLRHGFKLSGINNPSITSDEMDEIVSLQIKESNDFIKRYDIKPRDYNFEQIRELIDAEANGLNITHYKNAAFSAEHMYICKSLQIHGFEEYSKITPSMELEEAISLRESLFISKDNKLDNILKKNHNNNFSHN